jgi:hypothetical protein
VIVACSHERITQGQGAEDPFLPQVYTDPRFGFSLHYPEGLRVTHPPAGEHREVLVFARAATQTHGGFQITIDAYDEPGPVTPELLQLALPGKVIRDPQPLPVDTVTALALASQDPGVGATYEVWWIHHAMIYQVATAAADADMLRRVLQTWRFDAGGRHSMRSRGRR